MASKHKQSTLGETCYITDGAHAKVERQESGVLYLTSKNFNVGSLKLDKIDYISEQDFSRLFTDTKISQRKLRDGDVLTGIIGTFGNAYRYTKDDHFGISSSVAILRPDQKVLDPDFLYYVLTSQIFKATVEAYKGGSVQGYTNIATLKVLPIPLPDILIQKNIISQLKVLDDKIQLNRQANQTLEKMAQALFKSWFVDFDPVIDNALEADNPIPDELQERAERRKQQLAKPNHKLLPEDIRQLFSNEFELTEEMGWVPKGWEVSNIASETDFKNGYAFKSKDLLKSEENTLPVFKMGHIHRGGGFKAEGTKSYFPSNKVDKVLSEYLAKKGDLLMSMTDMKSNMVILGNTALMPVSDTYLVNQRVGRLRASDKSNLNYPYLYYFTNHPPVVEELRSRANSGVQVNLTTASIKETPILVPDINVHSEFDKQVKPFLEKTFENDASSKSLAQLRDTLLPKLISGELRLPSEALQDVEQQLAETIA
jgi:type I restriction enzyme S subunit